MELKVLLNALFNEYLDYRARETWGSYTNMLTDPTGKVKLERANLVNKFNTLFQTATKANSFKEWNNVITTLVENLEQTAVLFNQVIHAARTAIVKHIKSAFLNEYKDHIKKLLDEYQSLMQQVTESRLKGEEISPTLYARYRSSLLPLVYLQWRDALFQAIDINLIPYEHTTKRNAYHPVNISEPVDPNRPLIFNDHFHDIYYAKEVLLNPLRAIEFHRLISTPINNEKKEISLLNNSCFPQQGPISLFNFMRLTNAPQNPPPSSNTSIFFRPPSTTPNSNPPQEAVLDQQGLNM